MQTSLPVLDDITIRNQCRVPWDHMAGTDQVRHCAVCDQQVYNIAAMTRDEAIRFLAERQHSVCLRLIRRPDNTVITRDCIKPSPRQTRGVWYRLLAAIASLVGINLTGCQEEPGEIAIGPMPPQPPAAPGPQEPPAQPQKPLVFPEQVPPPPGG